MGKQQSKPRCYCLLCEKDWSELQSKKGRRQRSHHYYFSITFFFWITVLTTWEFDSVPFAGSWQFRSWQLVVECWSWRLLKFNVGSWRRNLAVGGDSFKSWNLEIILAVELIEIWKTNKFCYWRSTVGSCWQLTVGSWHGGITFQLPTANCQNFGSDRDSRDPIATGPILPGLFKIIEPIIKIANLGERWGFTDVH